MVHACLRARERSDPFSPAGYSPPFLVLVAPLYTVSLICMWWSVLVVFCMMGIGVAEGFG